MTAPTFANALVLLYGTLLAPGRRTVCAALRVMGLEHDPHFTNDHRVLNRARWAPFLLSRLLLGLLVRSFVPPGAPLRILIDETLEARGGAKIDYKSWFRDAVRSSANHVAKRLGVRWLCCCLLVSVPWSRREWALPFLVIPVLAPTTCRKLGKRARSGVEWAGLMLARVRRWFPERQIIAVGDGYYTALPLVAFCQGLHQPVTLVTRGRWDHRFFDEPGPQPKGKRGPKPKKGPRQPLLKERLADPATAWETHAVRWYGGQTKRVQWVTGVSLWHRGGHEPVRLRWVILRSPPDRAREEKPIEAAVLLCSDPEASAAAILAALLGRWNIEVTFEELRAHLGFGTQRHWSQRAIERTTPCLFGIFSLVVLMAQRLHPEQLPVQQSDWYPKAEATFADALAAVREHLWQSWNYERSAAAGRYCQIPLSLFHALRRVACRAA